MKQTILFAAIAAISISCFNTMAQGVPQGISYQAIAREVDGDELTETSLLVRIGILSGSINGTLEYQETHSANTNEFGLFTLVIGQGFNNGMGTAASFAAINWAATSHFLKVEIDPAGGPSAFELMGTSELLTVPYAFHAATVQSYNELDGDPENETIGNFELTGTQLIITEAGDQYSVDLSNIGGNDDDADPANELITSVVLNGQSLEITEGGNMQSVNLAMLEEGWTVETGKVYNNTDKIGIGTANPLSTLHVNGSMSLFVTNVSGGTTITANANNNVFICNVDAGDIEINLPQASTCTGRVYTFKRYASQPVNYANNVTVLPFGNELIDGELQFDMGSVFEQSATIISDGTAWWVIAGFGGDQ